MSAAQEKFAVINGNRKPILAAHLSDEEVADQVRMLLRHDINHEAIVTIARDRIYYLSQLINSPETEDFLQGVRLEAAHQVDRWGEAHDRDKSAENWFWLVGYLTGKALRAALTGDRTKALHHCISSAAALLNWHKTIRQDATGCGAGADNDIRPAS